MPSENIYLPESDDQFLDNKAHFCSNQCITSVPGKVQARQMGL